MSEDIFFKIISELEKKRLAKDLIITFSKFNEPTYDLELLSLRSRQLRLYLPETKLYINTNGDFLDTAIFDLPITRISIMDYDRKGEEYGRSLLKKLGAGAIKKSGYRLYTRIKGREALYLCDWPDNYLIEDRGNLLGKLPMRWKREHQLRERPCKLQYISIDYRGNVTPCCHIRAEADKHREYIMGNLNESTLDQIIEGEKFKEFRRVMSGSDSSKYYYPCVRCHKYQ